MTPEEYISTGILETYALGSASPAEMQEVESMVSKYPEVKKALDEILADVEAYATLHAVEPDASLREKILAEISSGKSENKKQENNFTANARLNEEVGQGKVIPLQPVQSNSWKIVALAASVVLILSVGINIYFWANSNASNNDDTFLKQVAAATTVSDSLQAVVTSQQKAIAERDSTLHVLDFIRNPMTQSVTLNSMVKGHPMKAVVHWDMSSMKVAVDPMTLPATNNEEKYVLWAIVDGKPINEGDFYVDANTGIQMMSTIPKADSFAISLETNEKVEAPVGLIYVSGKPSPSQP